MLAHRLDPMQPKRPTKSHQHKEPPPFWYHPRQMYAPPAKKKRKNIPQTMQHRTRPLHHHQNRNGQEKPHVKRDDDHDDAQRPLLLEGAADRHVPQHDGQLLVREREGPEAQVGGRVGAAVEAEFCFAPS